MLTASLPLRSFPWWDVRVERDVEWDHRRVVQYRRDGVDTGLHRRDGRSVRDEWPVDVRRADQQLGRREVAGTEIVVGGRRGGDDGDGDADRQRDGGKCCAGSGLVAAEVTQRQATSDRDTTSTSGQAANQDRTDEQHPGQDRHDADEDEDHLERRSALLRSASDRQAHHASDEQDDRRATPNDAAVPAAADAPTRRPRSGCATWLARATRRQRRRSVSPARQG